MSTNSIGIMEQIRQHVAGGKSSREVIDLGYAPGSVYKAQKQVRRRQATVSDSVAPITIVPAQPMMDEEAVARLDELEEETEQLEAIVDELSDQVAWLQSLESGVGILEERIKGLEEEARRRKALEEESRRREVTMSQKIQDQTRRIDNLDKRAKTMTNTAMVMGLVLYHLDVHHRGDMHGLPRDPADGDIRLNDNGYLKMQGRLRDFLERESKGFDKRKRFGLAVRMEDLGIVEWPPADQDKLA